LTVASVYSADQYTLHYNLIKTTNQACYISNYSALQTQTGNRIIEK